MYELSAGDIAAASQHLRESVGIFRALNDQYGILAGLHNLGLAEYLGGEQGAAQALFTETLHVASRTGIKLNMAYALVGLALAGNGDAGPDWAARMHGVADQALADLGHAMEPLEGRLVSLDRQRLRAAMGTDAFDTEYAAGRIVNQADVLAAALATLP
jgi:hypothetical protein